MEIRSPSLCLTFDFNRIPFIISAAQELKTKKNKNYFVYVCVGACVTEREGERETEIQGTTQLQLLKQNSWMEKTERCLLCSFPSLHAHAQARTVRTTTLDFTPVISQVKISIMNL